MCILPLLCEPTEDLSYFDIFHYTIVTSHYTIGTSHGPSLIKKKKKKNPQRDKLALFLLHKTVELWLTNNSLVIGTSSPDGRNNSFSSPREAGFELPGECHTKAKLDLDPTVSLMGAQTSLARKMPRPSEPLPEALVTRTQGLKDS